MSSCTILACVLSILVQLVSPVDGHSHSSYNKQHSCTGHKESRIASQHGHLSSKVASSNCHSFDRVALAVVVLAAQDTGFGVMISKTGKLEEPISTLRWWN